MPNQPQLLDVWIIQQKIQSQIYSVRKFIPLISLIDVIKALTKTMVVLLEIFWMSTWNFVKLLVSVTNLHGFQTVKRSSFCTQLQPICSFNWPSNLKNRTVDLKQTLWLNNCLFSYFFWVLKFPSSKGLRLIFSQGL